MSVRRITLVTVFILFFFEKNEIERLLVIVLAEEGKLILNSVL